MKHRWRNQIPGDPTRAGCPVCGGERHTPPRRVARYRKSTERTWSRTEPACEPVKGHSIPFNPENARRALRSQLEWPAGARPHKVKNGERCPCCGYGKTASEGSRIAMDFFTLEAEDPVFFKRAMAMIKKRKPKTIKEAA